MVPQVDDKRTSNKGNIFTRSMQSNGKDGACKCLLEDSSSRQFQKRSFLVRFAQSLGFVKSIFKSLSSYSLNIEEDGRSQPGSNENQDWSPNRSKSLPNFMNRNCNTDEIDIRTTDEAFSNNSVSTESVYGTFLNFSDLEPVDNLLIQIKEVVSNSQHSTRVAISELVALSISRDIVELAEHEPCGLKGCTVMVYLEDCGTRTLLGDFNPKEGFLRTFEVHVDLSIKRRLLRSFIPFLACRPQTQYVSDKYEISKEKLYTCSGSRGGTPVPWQNQTDR
eukprot:gene11892-13124_t